jgi:two-component system OmpR family sensor kinase
VKRPWPLRTRLFLAIGTIVVLSVGLTLAVGVVLTRRAVEHAKIQEVGNEADLLAARERISLAPLFHLEALRPFLLPLHEVAVKAPLDRPSRYLTAERAAEVRAGRRVQGTVGAGGVTYYFAARPVAGSAFVLLRRKRLDASLAPFANGLLLAAAVGAILAAAASFVLARAIARPVRRVAGAAGSLAHGEHPDPLPAEGAEELVRLADAFNDLAEQLARARAAERQFLLSVSHELKTPLTAIRGYAEGIVDGAFAPDDAAATIGREAGRLERLVGDLLDLARMNRSEFSVETQDVDLAEIAREAVERYAPVARAFDVRLEATGGPAPAVADPDRVLQVVSNLVENALRLAAAGGLVAIEAAPGLVSVEDDGPGLRPDELPHAFERFYLWSRYGRERPVGTGLGLAIVKELTQAMGGTVSVHSGAGERTRFSVRLPLPAAVGRSRRGAEIARARK